MGANSYQDLPPTPSIMKLAADLISRTAANLMIDRRPATGDRRPATGDRAETGEWGKGEPGPPKGGPGSG